VVPRSRLAPRRDWGHDLNRGETAAPLVSVVTPCLNPGPAALRRCLESVAAQTYTAVEHIVIDGGSTDGTVALLEDAGVRFVSEPDQGQTAALNKGFRIARGEVVTWLNADDALLPNAVTRAVGVLEAEPEVGWVYGDCELEEGDHRGKRTPEPALSSASFAFGSPVAQPGTFMRASALERVGYLDEELHLAMDFDLWLRLVLAGVASRYVPETLAVFTIHPLSKTGSLGVAEFQREESAALAKAGLTQLAAATLGRAAANAAFSGGRVPRCALAHETGVALAGLPTLSGRVVRAFAHLEAARLERPLGLIAFRHLLAWEPWLEPRVHARLAVAAARFLRG
jgi:hypothetical protein